MKLCAFCSTSFNPRKARLNDFCSRACANKSRRKHHPKPCAHCGQLFQPPRKHMKQKCCSLGCRDKAQTTSEQVPCAWCGNLVVRTANRRRRLAHAFCCTECMRAWRLQYGPRGTSHVQHVDRVAVACVTCGAELLRVPSKRREHNFCHPRCRTIWQQTSGYTAGEKSPSWLDGEVGYRGPNWQAQRLLALQRDRYTCQSCGGTAQLQVHHVVYPFRL